jgi:hypothetical protein
MCREMEGGSYFGGTVHAIGGIAVISRVTSTRGVLVHVDGDVRREASEPFFDVAGLLARELRVVAIGVVVTRQRTLKV